MNILMISDAHYSIGSKPEYQRWFPGIVKLHDLVKLLQKAPRLRDYFLSHWDKATQQGLNCTLERAAEKGPYDGLISLGDNTPGCQESGLVTNETLTEAREFRCLIRQQLETDVFNIFVPGGHDLGYCSTIGTKGRGGPSQRSFDAFTEVYGPLYGVQDLNDEFQFFWLASEPLMATGALVGSQIGFGYRYDINNPKFSFLSEKKKAQLSFLKEALLKSKRKFFLAVHDPVVLTLPDALPEILESHLDRLAAVFCGHLHARWPVSLMPKLRDLRRQYRLQAVPSTWGNILPWLWLTTGSGWCRLEIQGNQATFFVYWTAKNKGKRFEIC